MEHRPSARRIPPGIALEESLFPVEMEAYLQQIERIEAVALSIKRWEVQPTMELEHTIMLATKRRARGEINRGL
jgi:hypothetical protein